MSSIGNQSIRSIKLSPFACMAAAAIVATIATIAGGAAVVRGSAPAQDPELRCNPVAERRIEPRVVPAGDPVDVRVTFDYACSDVERTIYFYLVVENSESMNPGGFGGRAHFENAKAGMVAFIDQIDFDNGSRGGLIVYAASASERIALREGSGGKSALKSAVNGLSTAGGSANAAGDAVELAAQKLLEAETDESVSKVILLIDAGATITTSIDDIVRACHAAADEGITVSVMSLRDTEGRLAECAPEHQRHSASRPSGEDIPEKLEYVGDGLARADQADLLSVSDQITAGFAYVAGSASPREPDIFFANEIGWDFMPPPPEEGHELTYRMSTGYEIAGTINFPSIESFFTIFYADGSFAEIDLENPEVCVHPPGNPDFCEEFIVTLTPMAPTDTPTTPPEETPTATGEPPTPTEPAPEETPTHMPTAPGAPTIYMPYASPGR